MADNTTSSQSLATESFSFSWLESQQHHKTISNNNNNNNNNNHSLLLDENQTTINNNNNNNNNFNFDISNSKSNSSSLVHADKLFSNGLILPQYLNQPSITNTIIASSSSGSLSPSPPLLVNSRVYHHRHHQHPSSSFRRMFMGKWSKFIPRKIFRKYVKCLVPIKESIGMGGGTRVDDVNRLTLWEVASSPKKEVEIEAYSSTTTWSDIDESSISDAILYCKRSSGLC